MKLKRKHDRPLTCVRIRGLTLLELSHIMLLLGGQGMEARKCT